MTEDATETMNDRYERHAKLFRQETGLMAPGKDEAAAAYSGHTYEERWEAWIKWHKERKPT